MLCGKLRQKFVRKRQSEICVRWEMESAMAFYSLDTRLREVWRWCLLATRAISHSNGPTEEAELTLPNFSHPWDVVLSA